MTGSHGTGRASFGRTLLGLLVVNSMHATIVVFVLVATR